MGFGSRVSSSPSPPFSFLGSSVLDSGPVIQSKVGPSLGSLGSGFWLLRMMLQDDNLLDFLGSVALSDKEMVVEAKELEPSKAMESTCVSVGKSLVLIAFLVSLPILIALWGCWLRVLKRRLAPL